MYDGLSDRHGDLLFTNSVTRFIANTKIFITPWESLRKLQQLEPLNFGGYLFLNGSYQQADTYAVNKRCSNLAFYSLIFISMLLQWNSVIPYFWMILFCKWIVIDTYMTSVTKKIFSTWTMAYKG